MGESDLMTRKVCWDIFGRALEAGRSLGVPDVEVMIGAGDSALTRFANNAIHQNVSERRRYLSVRVALDHRTARASTNRLDGASIRAVVEEAVAITRSSEPSVLSVGGLLFGFQPGRWAEWQGVLVGVIATIAGVIGAIFGVRLGIRGRVKI
jgi:hypothetical protein